MQGFILESAPGCMVVGCVGMTAAVILVIIVAIQSGKNKKEKTKVAYERYQSCLHSLKMNPINADLKQKALLAGREYSNLARDAQGRTLFDEVALMNDINAACAAATKAPSPRPAESHEERLRKLTDLKSKGLITEAEYDKRRAEILDSI